MSWVRYTACIDHPCSPGWPPAHRAKRRLPGGVKQGLELAVRADVAAAGRDERRLIQIGDLLQGALRTTNTLPDLETVRRRLRSHGPLAGVPTLAEYLPMWLLDLEVDENTRNSYACHVRLHLIPCLGDVVLDE